VCHHEIKNVVFAVFMLFKEQGNSPEPPKLPPSQTTTSGELLDNSRGQFDVAAFMEDNDLRLVAVDYFIVMP